MSDRLTIVNARIVTPDGIVEGGALSVVGDRIASVSHHCSGVHGDVMDLGGDWLLPGFLDTQVNGGGGVLFNDEPTVAAIATIGTAHAAFGTTGFLPTLISDDLEVIDAAMRAVEKAIDQGVPGVLGIHIEGPFIADARKGIHNPDKFRRLTESSIALLGGLGRGRTLVTLAPEMCTTGDIRALTAAGVVVAAGHTDASYAVMRAALDAGVTGFTHLFNAMSPLRHREPGVVGAALDDDESYCGIIVDGHHVDAVALRIAMRARPIDRFMLVTDAMPTVGSEQKSFMLGNMPIIVRDGVCVGPDGTLAGSDLDMAQALRNTITMTGVDVPQAAVMAATAPAQFMRIEDRGVLRPNAFADLVWLGRDLEVKAVWRAGVPAGSQRIAA